MPGLGGGLFWTRDRHAKNGRCGFRGSLPCRHGQGLAEWVPIIITRNGKPVVKLAPASEGEDEMFGALAGIARIKGDVENTISAIDWEVE